MTLLNHGDVVNFSQHAALGTAALGLLTPLVCAGFWREWSQRLLNRTGSRELAAWSACLCLPYLLVSSAFGLFRLEWMLLYLVLPPAVILLLSWAAASDPRQRGVWPDFLVLLILGLAVDLRWFEGAWPARMAVFNKITLLDLGIVGFFGARHLRGAGFDLRLRAADWRAGGREFLLYAPAAIGIGLWLGFLHLHRAWPRPGSVALAGFFTFFFIAVPEELFFRGWLQNLLERRLGRGWALVLTSIFFGLAHFNKRAAHFNWRYVLLAALAGVFYGRAWRRDRRVGASAVTHTLVDTVWSMTLR